MSSTVKNILIALLLGVIAYLLYLRFSNRYVPRSIYDAVKSEVVTWKNEAGKWEASATALEATSKEAKKFFEAEIERVQREYDVKVGKLSGVIETTLRTNDTIKLTEVKTLRDTVRLTEVKEVPVPTFTYSDEWGDFTLKREMFWDVLEYEVRDSITFVSHYVRNGVFKPRKLIIRGTSHNPNTQITGIDQFVIRENPNRFALGPQLGFFYNPITGEVKPSLGLGLTWGLIRF